MKRALSFPALLAGLFVLATVLVAADEIHKNDRDMKKKCREIMKDKLMADMMMDHIAADDALRSGMMEKMLAHSKARHDRMREMSGLMMANEAMKGVTMDDIAGDDQMRQVMMKKIVEHARGHKDEIRSMERAIRQDVDHSVRDDANAEGMQGEGHPVRMMNDKPHADKPAGK